jgi:hypothetical protein
MDDGALVLLFCPPPSRQEPPAHVTAAVAWTMAPCAVVLPPACAALMAAVALTIAWRYCFAPRPHDGSGGEGALALSPLAQWRRCHGRWRLGTLVLLPL